MSARPFFPKGLNSKGIGRIVTLVVVVLLFAAGGAAVKIVRYEKPVPASDLPAPSASADDVTDYESCAKEEGSKIQESYPEVCENAGGYRFAQASKKPYSHNCLMKPASEGVDIDEASAKKFQTIVDTFKSDFKKIEADELSPAYA